MREEHHVELTGECGSGKTQLCMQVIPPVGPQKLALTFLVVSSSMIPPAETGGAINKEKAVLRIVICELVNILEHVLLHHHPGQGSPPPQ